MADTGKGLSRWLVAGVALVLGAVLPLLVVLQDHAFITPEYRSLWSWRRAFLTEALSWNLWLLALPCLTRVVRRFPLEAKRWPRRLPLYLLAAAVVPTLHLAVFVALANPFMVPPRPYAERFFANWGGSVTSYEVFTFALLVAGVHAYAYARRYREEAVRVAELESQLVRSQLETLKMQVQPHFLFNTLNTISALMYQDVEEADRMIARLGGLLRASLQSAPRQRVPLREELEFLSGYLEIEKARLGERLTVSVAVEPAVLDAAVPSLLLQPLVENAVRHGISARRRPGQLTIEARRRGGELEIEIRDDGPGLPAGSFKEGIGLANVRARLERLHGRAQRFELKSGPEGGLTVLLSMPFEIHEE